MFTLMSGKLHEAFQYSKAVCHAFRVLPGVMMVVNMVSHLFWCCLQMRSCIHHAPKTLLACLLHAVIYCRDNTVVF